MNALKKVVLAILILSLIVFVALFGRLPALRYVFLLFKSLQITQINPGKPLLASYTDFYGIRYQRCSKKPIHGSPAAALGLRFSVWATIS